LSNSEPLTQDHKVDGTVLVIEDDEEDIFILRRALSKSPINLNLDIVQNGQDAIDYLVARHDDRTLTELSLILLDLNLPLMDGHAFLRWLREDPRFSALPVVVLTTSREPEIVKRAYQDGANAVVSKADTLEGMMKIVDTIVQFWFETAQKFYLD